MRKTSGILLAVIVAGGAESQFTPLGFAAGDGTYSHATSVSDDGSRVGGMSAGPKGLEPLIWDGLSPQALALPTGFTAGAYINDISGDGQHAVAISLAPEGFRGVYWDASGTPTVMPTPTGPGAMSAIVTINYDGSAMGGFNNQTFFPELTGDAWSSNAGTQTNHGDIPGGVNDASLIGVTNDGSTFVGYGNDGIRRPVKLTQSGFEVLPTVAGGSGVGIANNIGVDGGTIVGELELGGVMVPAYWDASGTPHTIEVPAGQTNGLAAATSADGSIIIGSWNTGIPDEFNSTAFIWDATNGARSLIDALENEYGYDLSGWSLHFATDITPDGRTIVGQGINPDGNLEAFKVVIPAPSSALLGVSVLGLMSRRRR